jgi:hypothetical protein
MIKKQNAVSSRDGGGVQLDGGKFTRSEKCIFTFSRDVVEIKWERSTTGWGRVTRMDLAELHGETVEQWSLILGLRGPSQMSAVSVVCVCGTPEFVVVVQPTDTTLTSCGVNLRPDGHNNESVDHLGVCGSDTYSKRCSKCPSGTRSQYLRG